MSLEKLESRTHRTRKFSILAGGTAAKHSLRGFDTIHLTSAVVIRAVFERRYANVPEHGGTETRKLEVSFYTYDNRLKAAARLEVRVNEPPDDGEEQPTWP